MTRAKKDVEPTTEEVTETSDSIPLFNANDGIHGRDGGPYLDQVEAKHFEEFQAARDGGEPDYDNPRGYPGIQLNTAHQQQDSYNPTTLAGDDVKDRHEFDVEPIAYATLPLEPAPETEEEKSDEPKDGDFNYDFSDGSND